MKNNLWIFGDSFSSKYDDKLVGNWANAYMDWKGYVPKIYGEILAEELGYTHRNYAVGGSDNYTIFDRICTQSDRIGKDDLIIVNWSSLARIRILDKNDRYINFIPNFINKFDIKDYFLHVTDDCVNEIMLNRYNSKFSIKNEIEGWMKLLRTTFGNRILFWTPFGTIMEGCLIPEPYVEVISHETKSEVNDGHYSEKGHVFLSNILKSKLFEQLGSKNII